MIKKYKWTALISSVAILLPALFGIIVWNQLPENMTSHWGGDGVADGFSPKAFMVFGIPLLLLAIHWLCLLLTSLDKKSAEHNIKIVRIIYWLMPVLSFVVNAMIYSVGLGLEWDMFMLLPLLLGTLFIVLGNYMPKITRNRHMGIKIRWTMGNDENWQKTHRLGGKMQVLGGALMLLSVLFPEEVAIGALVVALVLSVGVPTVYSYMLYRKHKAAGIKYELVFNKKSDKIALWIAAIVVPIILIGVGILMFVGDVSVKFDEESFTVGASFSETLTIRYDELEKVEYRENFDTGHREMGFGSPKLSTGTFKNKEFGRYTLYAYTGGEGCVILTRGEKTLVIVGKTLAETKEIYDTLVSKIQ